jgi:hypothetical protein
MKDNRLGCLTGTGFLAAFITLFVIVGAAFVSGGHMFSSGDLNDQMVKQSVGLIPMRKFPNARLVTPPPGNRT